jgi:hypothetical protein
MMPFTHGLIGKKGASDAVGNTKRLLILMAEAGSGHRSAAEVVAAALQGLHDSSAWWRSSIDWTMLARQASCATARQAYDETVRRVMSPNRSGGRLCADTERETTGGSLTCLIQAI